MTAFAAALFALGALMSVWVIVASWQRHGRDALALRARLAACPDALVLTWKMIERIPVPVLAPFRPDRQARPGRLQAQRPGLEWPGAGFRTPELAA